MINLKKMKKYFFAILALVVISCSKDEEEKPKIFRFLEFRKDVLLPNINESEISFLAMDFDTKVEEWEITLSNGTINFPVSIKNIEKTAFSWNVNPNSPIQVIYLRIPKLEYGDYTLMIKNNLTNQVYSDVFLVRSKTFKNVKSSNITTYTMINSEPQDYLYFQNTSNTIEEDPNPNSVQQVFLENKTTQIAYSVNYQILNGNINFDIPLSIPVGSYFLSIKYNTGLTSYFEKDIIILDQQLPSITAINKNLFSGAEEIKIDGLNFRYKILAGILPVSGLSNTQTETVLVFKDINREYNFSYGRYAQFDPNYNDISNEGTKLVYKIPSISNANIFTDSNRTYFEGVVFVKCGPYKSNSINVKIVY